MSRYVLALFRYKSFLKRYLFIERDRLGNPTVEFPRSHYSFSEKLVRKKDSLNVRRQCFRVIHL
jgi:hypothetical protein